MRLQRSSKQALTEVLHFVNTAGRLEIVFSDSGEVDGKIQRKRLHTNTAYANKPENRQMLSDVTKMISREIECGEADLNLQQYTPASLITNYTPVNSTPTLDEIWEYYSAFKKPQVSPSTFAKDFQKQKNHISRLPSKSLNDAVVIRDYLQDKLSPNAAKRCLTQIKACCNWAMAEGLIGCNSFASMQIEVKTELSEEREIVPFTKEERDLIISTFASDRYYSHYTPYVRFLFFTGCRPSEAIGLKWKHITSNVIQFRESVVIAENGLVLKEGLKTQKKRDFPLTSELKAILDEIRPKEENFESLVFTSPTGKFIDHHNFSNRAWKAILTKCNLPYRKSYQTRHTFISLCIEANINNTAIGRWTGTSSKMIDNHYGATNFINLKPPDLS